ncbi:hypothetical protein AB0E11_07600 [Streptomyces fradiae]|uniref:Uncharacterized protein n=1 Tax=Streptomyces rubrolavendulae TaxID=285473 RepID=A0A1D8G213_9ACTN|nr:MULTISPECIES: hypothetical protein [Streptomyces]AOT59474.1 hypothetical protein A4G23_02316 [Streptomyces rubrolavendulae]
MRHARAVAVCAVVLIALTGARGSNGGSCGGSSSSGSGSGTSGGSGGHGDTDGGGTAGQGDTGGSGSGGVSVPGGSGSGSGKGAMRDIRVDRCGLDASGKNLVARLTITNNGPVDYEYDATVQFRGAAGSGTPDAAVSLRDLVVPANGTKTTEATTPYTGTQNGAEYTRCSVTRAARTLT